MIVITQNFILFQICPNFIQNILYTLLYTYIKQKYYFFNYCRLYSIKTNSYKMTQYILRSKLTNFFMNNYLFMIVQGKTVLFREKSTTFSANGNNDYISYKYMSKNSLFTRYKKLKLKKVFIYSISKTAPNNTKLGTRFVLDIFHNLFNLIIQYRRSSSAPSILNLKQ